MKEKETRVARRHFLAGAGIVTAAAGAAALTARTPAAPRRCDPRAGTHSRRQQRLPCL
ncbi:hypothetical protein OJJOAM_001196 [Cupriavidus sp. H18C1]